MFISPQYCGIYLCDCTLLFLSCLLVLAVTFFMGQHGAQCMYITASFLWQHPKVGFVHLLLWVEKWTQRGWRMCFWIPSSWTGILYGNVQACPWVGKQGPITVGATYSPPTLSVRWIPSTSGSCASPMLPPVCLLTAITCCFLCFVSVHFPFPIVAWAS